VTTCVVGVVSVWIACQWNISLGSKGPTVVVISTTVEYTVEVSVRYTVIAVVDVSTSVVVTGTY
jgi:hypothetical protein